MSVELATATQAFRISIQIRLHFCDSKKNRRHFHAGDFLCVTVKRNFVVSILIFKQKPNFDTNSFKNKLLSYTTLYALSGAACGAQ
ncbi:hypothetical protein [Cupriavidus sp. EM10]|uniref:hypothetical protein n=1 Tax=Cupriavidus sp. EM10 TaxID=2839983 RepID=UPI001C007569|nr:hypothetical protein [Cupriavidus sp. EM10]QWE96460.1 hypothetical protein KLP38_25270 [Cupriavidus sp. EM10]